jgi:hypothetical protein
MNQTDGPRFYSVYADDPMYVHLVKERDEARAEIERLRAALFEAGKQLARTEDHWQAKVESLQQQRAELMLRIARLQET